MSFDQFFIYWYFESKYPLIYLHITVRSKYRYIRMFLSLIMIFIKIKISFLKIKYLFAYMSLILYFKIK